MNMKNDEDVHEVVSRPHLQKAFWIISTACTSKTLHPRSEEEQCLGHAVGRDHCNKLELGIFLSILK